MADGLHGSAWIARCGGRAWRLFATSRRARVAAVFARSFYLQSGDRFACVGRGDIGDGPLNAILAGDPSAQRAALSRRVGEPALITHGNIIFEDGGVLPHADARLWQPLRPRDPMDAAQLHALLQAAELRAPAEGLIRLVLCSAPARDFTPPGKLSDPSPVPPAPSWPRRRPPTTTCDTHSLRGVKIDHGHERNRDEASCATHVGSRLRGNDGMVGNGIGSRPRAAEFVDPKTAHDLSSDRSPQSIIVHRVARPAIAALGRWLARRDLGEVEPLRPAVAALVGLGPGLTPSGDDLLAGALIGLHAAREHGKASELAAVVRDRARSATSPLSRAFLEAAADGEAGAAVHAAVAALLWGTPADLEDALDLIDATGHTSGWDTLAGVALAARALAGHRPSTGSAGRCTLTPEARLEDAPWPSSTR